ncbi:MAG: 50S ribosomal protein L33 [Myxococcales bacterium]|nr:50S ribosomal protein L33 [Myxococcales bacterium]MDH3486274.1 50S ribosomal protein L33 [Myxococcales bacterium]
MSAKRGRVALVCEKCGARNYQTSKAKKTGPQERLALRKFCRNCNRHTEHKESK